MLFTNFHFQAPRSTRARSIRGSSRNIHSNMVAKQQASNIHWQSIVDKLDQTLGILSGNHVSTHKTYHMPALLFQIVCNWDKKILVLRNCCNLCILQVPPMFTRKIFSQVFSFINVQLFNR